MNYQKIQVKQLSGAGGAEITGVDLASADDQTIAEIESALHEFLVVTLPDQPLDDAQLAKDLIAQIRHAACIDLTEIGRASCRERVSSPV